jgi:heme oxygenase (biliverdin-IX-beta and delta-forming)
VFSALDIVRYRSLLAALHGFVSPWEQAVRAACGTQYHRWNAGRHVDRLRADLAVSGGAASRPPRCTPPALHGTAGCLGSLYVIEGSMLGGKILSRRVEAALGFTRDHGCRYFGAHDDDVGARWRDFRAALQAVDAREHAAATAAASETFDRLHAWLRHCEVID